MTATDTSPKALRKLAKSARKLNTLTLGSSGWGAHLAEVLGAVADEKEAASGLLTYRGFSCTADHAGECAYLLNLAEADDETGGGDAMTIISLYVSGDMTMDEALADLAPVVEQENPSCP